MSRQSFFERLGVRWMGEPLDRGFAICGIFSMNCSKVTNLGREHASEGRR
jgi:hypothetical protein